MAFTDDKTISNAPIPLCFIPFTARLHGFLAVYQPSAKADGNRTGCTGPGPCQTIPVFASPLLHKGVDFINPQISTAPAGFSVYL